jgi:hypothetical protein
MAFGLTITILKLPRPINMEIIERIMMNNDTNATTRPESFNSPRRM